MAAFSFNGKWVSVIAGEKWRGAVSVLAAVENLYQEVMCRAILIGYSVVNYRL
jgi:hypothetical protein